MPLQATSGAASYDAFGGGVAVVPTYIENVFSTYLYSGSASTQTITNNIDLSGKGGLVWIKIRNDTLNNILFDTTRGDFELVSNSTAAQANNGRVFATSSTGFSLKGGENATNNTPNTYASWTFREQPKFFDIVTYTGNGLSSNIISHNLGSVPGFIICKRTDSTSGWAIWHRGNGTTSYGLFALNSTAAATANFSAAPTSTTFDAYNIWDTGNPANASGGTYVAYLFAHNAGGFGLTGTDNVISCGSYTTDGSNKATVNLGYEPQWLLIKRTDSAGAWYLMDTTRSWSMTAGSSLNPNSSSAEAAGFPASYIIPTATGFQDLGAYGANVPFIYIAIRRGPMAVPTTGTSVFSPTTYSGNNTSKSITGVGFAPDLIINKPRANTLGAGNTGVFWDRLRGFPDGSANPALVATSTADEATWASLFNMFGYINNTNSNPQDGYRVLNGSTDGRYVNYSSEATGYISWSFKRAPSFFDEVCYTGTSVVRTVSHNLAAVPELMIIKSRSDVRNWAVYVASGGPTKFLNLNLTNALQVSSTYWNDTTPTSTVFTLGAVNTQVNFNNENYVAYLFATCTGVSKVGSYTGNGTTQTIDCGFGAGGARFVLIKRTDSTGDWYVYDTARGMTALTDPYLLLNSTAAEVATLGSVTTVSTGFALNSTILAAINVNAGTYIFLAIA